MRTSRESIRKNASKLSLLMFSLVLLVAFQNCSRPYEVTVSPGEAGNGSTQIPGANPDPANGATPGPGGGTGSNPPGSNQPPVGATAPPNPNPTPMSEYVQNIDFGLGTSPSTITLTRNGIATFYDSGGLLTQAQPGVARFDYDPATRRLRGLLVEPSSTNFVRMSAALNDTGFWVARQSFSDGQRDRSARWNTVRGTLDGNGR